MTIEESLKRILYLSYHLSDVQKHAEALTGIGENNSEDQNHVVLSHVYDFSPTVVESERQNKHKSNFFAPVKTFFSICFFFTKHKTVLPPLPVSQIKTKVKEL